MLVQLNLLFIGNEQQNILNKSFIKLAKYDFWVQLVFVFAHFAKVSKLVGCYIYMILQMMTLAFSYDVG
jgi:hypothetical protein